MAKDMASAMANMILFSHSWPSTLATAIGLPIKIHKLELVDLGSGLAKAKAK
jgi:hypothetical protein